MENDCCLLLQFLKLPCLEILSINCLGILVLVVDLFALICGSAFAVEAGRARYGCIRLSGGCTSQHGQWQ